MLPAIYMQREACVSSSLEELSWHALNAFLPKSVLPKIRMRGRRQMSLELSLECASCKGTCWLLIGLNGLLTKSIPYLIEWPKVL